MYICLFLSFRSFHNTDFIWLEGSLDIYTGYIFLNEKKGISNIHLQFFRDLLGTNNSKQCKVLWTQNEIFEKSAKRKSSLTKLQFKFCEYNFSWCALLVEWVDHGCLGPEKTYLMDISVWSYEYQIEN